MLAYRIRYRYIECAVTERQFFGVAFEKVYFRCAAFCICYKIAVTVYRRYFGVRVLAVK